MQIILELIDAPQTTVDNAKAVIEKNNGFFTGDIFTGAFSIGGVEGIYSIHVQFITISITKKPFFITEKYIKKTIMQYFNLL